MPATAPRSACAEADPDIQLVVLTTEEEGIGYLAGAWLGGERGALLMQSLGRGQLHQHAGAGGLGPLSLPGGGDDALGDWAEFNQWQNPMGQATEGRCA